MTKDLLHIFLEAFKELFFPPACLACNIRLPGNNSLLLCPHCRQEIRTISPPLCCMCGTPFPKAAGGNHFCSACLTTPKHFDRALAVLLYNDTVAKLVHAFKYGRATSSFATFRALKKSVPHLGEITPPDIIAPVPLHVNRLRHRGFNQALLLAAELLPELKEKIIPDLLSRTRDTTPQTSLNGKARRSNLRGAFRLDNKKLVQGKNILLVDDVYTTGTTLNECARVLKRGGAKVVNALTLARVEDP